MENLSILNKKKLKDKILYSKKRIREYYNYYNGQIYVSFSGGLDSLVTLHLVRSIYPDVKGVFVDTGLEYPEIKKFVKTWDNIEIIRPKKTFKEVIDNYGYPVVSKTVSMSIDRYNNTKDPVQKELRLHGGINPSSGRIQKVGVIPKKWQFLINAPFKISEKCCYFLKKAPLKTFYNKNKLHPIVGTRANESNQRAIIWNKEGCNSFKGVGQSRPLSIWTREDVEEYIKINEIQKCSVYDFLDRTGCVFCLYGYQYEQKGKTRFDHLKQTHSKLYDYCMNNLGIKEVIEYMENNKENQFKIF